MCYFQTCLGIQCVLFWCCCAALDALLCFIFLTAADFSSFSSKQKVIGCNWVFSSCSRVSRQLAIGAGKGTEYVDRQPILENMQLCGLSHMSFNMHEPQNVLQSYLFIPKIASKETVLH